MLAQKKFFIILGSLIVILLVGVTIIFLLHNKFKNSDTFSNVNYNINNSQSKDQTKSNNQIINSDTNKDISNNNEEIDNQEQDTNSDNNKSQTQEQTEILAIAKNFAARYGTYSNQNNSSNLISLKSYMTANMQAQVDEMIADNKSKPTNKYHGITTQALAVNLVNYEQGKTARVIVNTIRTEEKQGQDPVTYQQKLELNFVKEDNSWKVNQAVWK